MMSTATILALSDEAAAKAALYAKNPYVIYDDKEIDGYLYEVPFPFIGGYAPPGWEALRDEDGNLRFFQTDIAIRGAGLDHPFSYYFRHKIRQYEQEAEEKGETYGFAVIEAGQFQFVVGVFRKTGEPTVEEPDEEGISEMQYNKQLELIDALLSYHVDSKYTAAPVEGGEDEWAVKVFRWLWKHDQMALELDTHSEYMPAFSLRRALPALIELDLLEQDSQLLLRDIDLDGHRLRMWDTQEPHSSSGPQTAIHYQLKDPDGNVIFEASDFGANCIDDDDTVRSLISFLTLQDGDVDDDYFKDYTDEQIDWRDSNAEELSLWALEPENYEDDPFTYYNVTDWGQTRFKPWGWKEKKDG